MNKGVKNEVRQAQPRTKARKGHTSLLDGWTSALVGLFFLRGLEMKIKVVDLESNPFRNLKKYPLSQEKINGLKISIKENGFWGGILVRKHPTKEGKYQMAFGHHRLQAVKESEYIYVDNTIVIKLTDDDMLHRMFAENHETWGARPSCILENVEGARNRLLNILDKYSWDRAGENTRSTWTDEVAFNKAKTDKVVGKTIILRYLGGLYNEDQVKNALNVLKEAEQPDSNVSLDAIKELPSMSHVEHFRKAVKEHETPKKTQKKIAKEITQEGIGRRGVADVVAKFSPPIPNLKKIQKRVHKSLPNIVEFVFKLETDTFDINRRLKALRPEMTELVNGGRLLGRLIPALTHLNKTILGVIEDYERAKEKTKKMAGA